MVSFTSVFFKECLYTTIPTMTLSSYVLLLAGKGSSMLNVHALLVVQFLSLRPAQTSWRIICMKKYKLTGWLNFTLWIARSLVSNAAPLGKSHWMVGAILRVMEWGSNDGHIHFKLGDPISYTNIRCFRKLGVRGIVRVKLVHARVCRTHFRESYHSTRINTNSYFSSHLGTLVARKDSASPMW